MGKVSQRIVTTTKTTKTVTSSRALSSKNASTPKSSQHPVDCCVHKTHSKK